MKPLVARYRFFGIFLLASVLASCGNMYHQPDERFVLVAANINLPYWQEAKAGLTDAAATLGVQADFIGPASYAPAEELDAFQKAAAQKPSGIMLSAAKPDLFTAAINGAVAQGTPVICIDSDVPGSRRILFVGTDNLRAGMESGRRMAELLRGKGRIVVISIPGQLNVDEREQGVNEALRKYPGVSVVQTIDDRGDPQIAKDQMSTLLQAKAKFDGIICLEASGGSGAAEALRQINKDIGVPIVAFDDDPQTLEWIARGAISATITQKPYVMSYYGLKLLDDLHHNAVHQFKDWRTALAPPMPTFVDTGTVVVELSHLALYRQTLAAHPKPQ
jgi:ribose transport system substrate-binding protein